MLSLRKAREHEVHAYKLLAMLRIEQAESRLFEKSTISQKVWLRDKELYYEVTEVCDEIFRRVSVGSGWHVVSFYKGDVKYHHDYMLWELEIIADLMEERVKDYDRYMNERKEKARSEISDVLYKIEIDKAD